MATAWLKVLGSMREPLDDDWQSSDHPGFSDLFVASRRRIRRMERGDGIAYYAATWRVVFAWGTLTSSPYQQDNADWPWRVDLKLEHSVAFVHEGLPIRQANVDRDLMISVRSKSHIELQPAEFKAIRAKL
jgi:hypothetical protein